MNNQVSLCMGQKRRAEDELNRLVKEYDEFKAEARENQTNDGREIVSLQGKLRDVQTRLESVENEKRHCLEQLGATRSDN